MLFSAILWGFRGFLGEPGCYFLRFCGFPGFPGRNMGVIFLRFCGVSGISWENLGGQELVRGKVAGGSRVARYFDPQFLNFCRRRCRPLWPAGLPRFKV